MKRNHALVQALAVALALLDLPVHAVIRSHPPTHTHGTHAAHFPHSAKEAAANAAADAAAEKAASAPPEPPGPVSESKASESMENSSSDSISSSPTTIPDDVGGAPADPPPAVAEGNVSQTNETSTGSHTSQNVSVSAGATPPPASPESPPSPQPSPPSTPATSSPPSTPAPSSPPSNPSPSSPPSNLSTPSDRPPSPQVEEDVGGGEPAPNPAIMNASYSPTSSPSSASATSSPTQSPTPLASDPASEPNATSSQSGESPQSLEETPNPPPPPPEVEGDDAHKGTGDEASSLVVGEAGGRALEVVVNGSEDVPPPPPDDDAQPLITSPPPPPPAPLKPVIAVDGPNPLTGGRGVSVSISNTGQAPMQWTVTEMPPWADLAPDSPWSGTLEVGSTQKVVLVRHKHTQPAPGDISSLLKIDAGLGGTAQIPIAAASLFLGSDDAPAPAPPTPPKPHPASAPPPKAHKLPPPFAPAPASPDTLPASGSVLPHAPSASDLPKLVYKKIPKVGDTQFQLELQNVGGGILQVNVTGPTWVDIIPKTTTLGPAQTILVDVHVNPGSSPNGQQSAVLIESNAEEPISVTVQSAPSSQASLNPPSAAQLSRVWILLLGSCALGGTVLVVYMKRNRLWTSGEGTSGPDIEMAAKQDEETQPLKASVRPGGGVSDAANDGWDHNWEEDDSWGAMDSDDKEGWGQEGWGEDSGWQASTSAAGAKPPKPAPTKSVIPSAVPSVHASKPPLPGKKKVEKAAKD